MDPVVILATESVAAGPGQEARLPVRVRNQGRRVESYRIDVVGAPAAFAEVTPTTVSVLPGREAEIEVVFRPPGGAATPTGSLPFAVRATSEVEASSSAAAEGHLELSGAVGLQAWVPETTRSGRWSTRYIVEFANHGNAAVRLAVTAHDPAGALTLRLSNDVVDLPPGGRATTELEAKVREPFLRGTPVNRVLTVACQNFPFGAERPVPGAAPPVDDPNHRTFQLAFQQKPILPKAAIPVALLVAAILIALVVLSLRGGEEFALDLTPPEVPPGFTAEAAGSTSIFVRWVGVPNASGYVLRGASTDGVPIAEVEIPSGEVSYQLGELQPATEYCLTLTALGSEEVDPSPRSDESCATTGQQSRLAPPSDVNVEVAGVDEYEVTWQHPQMGEPDLAFQVFVENRPVESPFAASPARIPIQSTDVEQTVHVMVQAVRGEEKSDFSESRELSIPPLPPETVPAVTTTPGGGPPTSPPASATTPPTVPPDTAGGPAPPGATTTAPSATPPSTVPTPAQNELRDLPPTWVAMLGQWTPAGQGGMSLRERKRRLGEVYEISPAEMDVFSNRDTVALEDGDEARPFAAVERIDSFVYVAQDSPEAAAPICEREPVGCRVLLLTGAARLAQDPGAILVLDQQDAQATIAEIDEAVIARRSALGRASVYVLNGAEYEPFGSDELIIYAAGFSDRAEVGQFCDDHALPSCRAETLTPR